MPIIQVCCTLSRIILVLFALFLASSAAAQYDAVIERAAARWMPEYDWRWLKAQCWQESRFNPRAVSPAGARGLCQFMPQTWSEAQRALGVRDVYSARENAWAAGWYMRRQLAIWTDERTDRSEERRVGKARGPTQTQKR